MPTRIVVDTNILVAASYAPDSAARQIVEACLAGRLQAIASRAVYREYDLIVAKAVRVSGYRERLALWRERLEVVAPRTIGRVVPDDPDDDKFVAAALGGVALLDGALNARSGQSAEALGSFSSHSE